MHLSFRKFLRSLHALRPAPCRAHLRPRFRLVLEELEGRVTPSTAAPVLGSEFRIDPATDNSSTPAVAINSSGITMVVWSGSDSFGRSDQVIEGQLYGADRNPIGGAFTIGNVQPGGGQTLYIPSVAADAAGNFAVVWTDGYPGNNGSPSPSQVYLRSYSADGTPLTAATAPSAINTTGYASVTDGALSADATGNFVLTWTTAVYAPTQYHGYVMRLDDLGNSLSAPIDVADSTNTTLIQTSVATSSAGTTMVVSYYFDQGNPPAPGQVTGQIFDSAGNAKGSSFVIDASISDAQVGTFAVVAADGQGHFDVFWRDNGVQGERFDALGNSLGAPFTANTSSAAGATNAGVAADAAGDFTVVWTTADVLARTYDPAGNPLGGEYVVNLTPAAGYYPQVAYAPGGDALFVYPIATGEGTSEILGRWSLVLSPSTLQPAQVGNGYGQLLSANFGTYPYTFAVTAGALPAGMSLTDAEIHGTPTAGGVFNFTVTVTDSSPTPYTVSQQYSLTVGPPTVTFEGIPGAPLNTTDYTAQLEPGGGTAPYSNFTISGGQLPAGLTLSSSGLISGTPTTAGVYLVDVAVTDSSTGTGPYTESGQVAVVVTQSGFLYSGSNQTLYILGTAAQNEFDYSQATTQDAAGILHTTYAFTLNGVELDLPNSILVNVQVSAQGQHNTAILITNDTYVGIDGQQHATSEIAVLGGLSSESGSMLARPDMSYQILMNGFQSIYAYMSGADSAELHGTISQGGANIFVSAGSYSYLTGLGQFFLVSGAPNVYAFEANAGDQAWHYDTAAMDSFVASGNVFSYVSGTDNGQSFFNEAVGFQVTYAIATHGQSYAYLIDSPGNDVFVGYAPYSYMSGSDNAGSLFNVAEGFVVVYGESFVGGTDFAYNYDPSHNILNSRWILLT